MKKFLSRVHSAYDAPSPADARETRSIFKPRMRRPNFLASVVVNTIRALALIVLTPFGLMENTMGGKLFPLWFSALLLALSWGVLAVGGAIACLRRGKVELEYSLDAHTIRLTERGRQVKSEELPLKDVNQLKRIGDGMKLKCGRKQARIFCDKVTCERIESMVYAERA